MITLALIAGVGIVGLVAFIWWLVLRPRVPRGMYIGMRKPDRSTRRHWFPMDGDV